MSGLLRDWLLDPTALLFLSSLVLGLFLMRGVKQRARRRSSKRGFASGKAWSVLALMTWLAFFAVSTSPVPVNALIGVLEKPYITEEECAAGSHLVLLGGGVDSRAESADDFYRMRSATFIRASVASQIALAEPDLRLVLAGGALRDVAEADVIAGYLQSLGILETRMILEATSANTYENAQNVVRLLDDELVTGPVRLVTSALHMHRALSVFETAFEETGFTICPVSTDIQGLLNVPAYAWMPQTTALAKFDLLLHEAVALVVYKLRGWI